MDTPTPQRSAPGINRRQQPSKNRTGSASTNPATNNPRLTYTVQQAAQQLDTGPNKLFRWLRNHHVLTIGNQPARYFIDDGLLKIRHGKYDHPIRGELPTQRAVFTRKGISWLKSRWAETQQENQP